MKATDKLTQSDIARYYAIRAPGVSQRNKRQWRGPCPLHGGERDSFTVQAETGMWACHSECNAGGDIIQFEQRMMGGAAIAEAIKSVGELLDTKMSEPQPMQPIQPKPQRKITATYPYRDSAGKLIYEVIRFTPKGFSQRRPDGNGRWIWNLEGVTPTIYNLAAVEKADAVIIVEGEADADRLNSLGYVATCNSGGAGKWSPAFAVIFIGKAVTIIPDLDAANPKAGTNEFPGQKHAAQVAQSLLGIADSVAIAEVPVGKDVSDYLREREDKRAAVDELLEKAIPVTAEPGIADWLRKWTDPTAVEAKPQPEAPEIKYFVPEGEGDPQKPNKLARAVMEERDLLTDASKNCYLYDGLVWRSISPEMLKSFVLQKDVEEATTQKRRNEAVDFILAYVRQDTIPWRSIEPWEVPVLNGVVDLRDFTLRPHRKEDYLETVLPVNYTPGTKCPTWTAALATWFGDDEAAEAKSAALQEFSGYVLTPHALYKKALLLYGEPDTGKSQAQLMLTSMVGRGNTCSIKVQDMDDPRKLAPIKGKMINALSELPSDAMIEDGGFKQLVSTGDMIQIDQKYREAENYFPFCKHVIASNVLPMINDLTAATYNRLLVIQFNRPLPTAKQDKQLLAKFEAEMEGILCWALEGARRLYERNGQFTEIAESTKILRDHRRNQNPLNDFLDERCVKEEGAVVSIADLRSKFNSWNRDAGYTRGYTTSRVRQMLKSAGLRIVDNRTVPGLGWA